LLRQDRKEDETEEDDHKENCAERSGEDRDEEDATALEYALHRAATAELENAPLLVEIARLNHENKHLRNRARNQRNHSSSAMIQMTNSTRANPSVGGASDHSRNDTDHSQHGRGRETRPRGAAKSGAKPVGKFGGSTGGRSGYAKTTEDLEKTAKKRQRKTYGEDEDSDE